MNKTLTFVLGLLTGAAAGSTATYFLVKKVIEERATEEIEAYAEHCERRIQRFLEKSEAVEEDNEQEEDDNDDEDPEIKNNEGVKKYHHYNGPLSSDGDRVFKDDKKEKDVTKEEVIKKWAEEDEANHISEVTEDEYLNADDDELDYHRETIDYFFDGDSEITYWGYNTDNQGTVEQKFGKPLKDLIGNAHKWLIDYTGEDGIGAAYFKNDNLGIIFEVIIHDSTGFNDRG